VAGKQRVLIVNERIVTPSQTGEPILSPLMPQSISKVGANCQTSVFALHDLEMGYSAGFLEDCVMMSEHLPGSVGYLLVQAYKESTDPSQEVSAGQTVSFQV